MYNFLIVDDEPIMRTGIRAMLTRCSLPIETVIEASNGLEALHMLASNQVHIVITDIRMPKMNGLELSSKISMEYPGIHTAIVTGFDDFQYAQYALRYGVKDYLLKPLNQDEFVKALSRIIESYENRNASIYINHDKVASIIQLLLAGIWNQEQHKLDEAHALMSELLLSLPRYYYESLLDDVLSTLLNALSEKTAYAIDFEIPVSESKTNRDEWLAWFWEYIVHLRNDVYQTRTNSDSLLIEKAQIMIEENYNRDLTLEELSHKIGFSPSYFSKLFKSHTGKNFVQFRSELRIQKAMELLNMPNKSIIEIAYEVGFNDMSHFIRTFKKQTSLLPNEYRKRSGADIETSF